MQRPGTDDSHARSSGQQGPTGYLKIWFKCGLCSLYGLCGLSVCVVCVVCVMCVVCVVCGVCLCVIWITLELCESYTAH